MDLRKTKESNETDFPPILWRVRDLVWTIFIRFHVC